MAKKPSERRSFKEETTELNLIPMMNLVSLLIPALLMSAQFVEFTVLNVVMPSIGAPSSGPQTPPEVQPLNLRVTVTERGYSLSGSMGPILPKGVTSVGPGPTIPIVQKTIGCHGFQGTWPPPRAKNNSGAKCQTAEQKGNYWVYDNVALAKMLVDIKEQFPDDNTIIIEAEPAVEYDSIIFIMDASREFVTGKGEKKRLFDEVILAPAVIQGS